MSEALQQANRPFRLLVHTIRYDKYINTVTIQFTVSAVVDYSSPDSLRRRRVRELMRHGSLQLAWASAGTEDEMAGQNMGNQNIADN